MMILLLALLVTVTTFVLLLRTIAADGYGHRPVPRSHFDSFGPRHHLR